MSEELTFPHGCRLLTRWQAGELPAKERLKELFDAAISGELDSNFATPPPSDHVNIGGSLNLLTLTIMHDLYGYASDVFYKGDAERYVRTTMLTRRLLGMNKLYVSWPVYGFTAEAMGQLMMYPDKFPPGADPDIPLITRENWQSIKTPDFESGIPKLIYEIIDCYTRLTGMDPILHVSAPYSLAADTFGQEPLLAAVVHEPEFVEELLNCLVDRVVQPWVDDFFRKYPSGWAEMSDASGSPFFIGPENCVNMAIRSIRRLVDENPWGNRVYDANYRGDYVTQAGRKAAVSGRRKRASKPASKETMSLQQLTEHKHSVCRDYVIRLHDDRVPMDFYESEAIARNVPLFAGVGASQIDRNSIENMARAKTETTAKAVEYTESIKRVARAIKAKGYESRTPPWPGTMYFEDISSESSFELVEILVGTALEQGAL